MILWNEWHFIELVTYPQLWMVFIRIGDSYLRHSMVVFGIDHNTDFEWTSCNNRRVPWLNMKRRGRHIHNLIIISWSDVKNKLQTLSTRFSNEHSTTLLVYSTIYWWSKTNLTSFSRKYFRFVFTQPIQSLFITVPGRLNLSLLLLFLKTLKLYINEYCW